ncbi:uncharacterized protein WCC33_014859 [Rhinophrynus dorsalis]
MQDSHVDSNDENKERGNWSRKSDYLLSMVGYAVGLGNVWRFPYLAYKNGGGAFLIPYTIMLALAGLPLFFLECSMGQFSSLGPVSVWRVVPLLQGVGITMVLITTLVSIYYNVIIAYSLYYMFASFQRVLPWSDCFEWADTNCSKSTRGFCSVILSDNETVTMNLSWVKERNLTCMANSTVMEKVDLPSKQYWEKVALRQSHGLDETGEVVWYLALCLLLAWIIVGAALFKGIKSSGKVVYFTAIFPYVVLLILLVRGATLEGAFDGIDYYIGTKSNINKLMDAEVWKDAATQIFFSLSTAWGGLIALSSYNKFHNNCYSDAIVVCVTNCLTSVFAGFAIFSILGHMAFVSEKSVSEVVDSGFGLAFIAYPEALSQLPISPLWSFLFFFMLLTLGLDSQFAMIETIITSIQDAFPEVMKRMRILITTGCCVVLYLLGLLCITQSGIFWVNLIDYFCGGWALLFAAVLELVGIIWIYGGNRFIEDIEMMIGKKHWAFWLWWRACWFFISPLLLTAILLWSLITFDAPKYGSIVYPKWGAALGWCMICFCIIWIPIIAIVKMIRAKGNIVQTCKAAKDWGPALSQHRGERYQHIPDKKEKDVHEIPTVSALTGYDNDAYLVNSMAVRTDTEQITDGQEVVAGQENVCHAAFNVRRTARSGASCWFGVITVLTEAMGNISIPGFTKCCKKKSPKTEDNDGEKNEESNENPEREMWANKSDYLLSMVGYAVGLGNVWRFPYLSFKHGGGAFLIPYTVMLAFAGLPLFFLESALGQFASLGPVAVWRAVPLFQGVGVTMVLISALVGIYYNVIVGYALYYLFASFRKVLPWADCFEWADEKCRSSLMDTCNVTMGNDTVTMNITLVKESNLTCINDQSIELPSKQYWEKVALQLSSGLDETGKIVWYQALCLLLAWVLVAASLAKGIKSSGKVVYFTALFPYVVLIILLVRGVTLEGAIDGIQYFIGTKSDISKLSNGDVWKDAATQIFYSLSTAWGGIIALSSYSKFRNNCYMDSIFVCVINCLTSVLAGFVIFSILGHMALVSGKDVSQVVDEGFALAFIAYPDALTKLPVSPLWAFLFFCMLLTLGLDSQFATIETVTTAVQDAFPEAMKKMRIPITIAICVVLYLLGLTCVTQAGIYWVQLNDYFSGGWGLLFIAVLELIGLIWIYGGNRVILDIEMMLGKKHWIFWVWWRACWYVISPLLLLAILIWSLVTFSPPKLGERGTPAWGTALGWLMIMFCIMWIPIIAIIKISKAKGTLWQRIVTCCRPSDKWGPALVKNRGERYQHMVDDKKKDDDVEMPKIQGHDDLEIPKMEGHDDLEMTKTQGLDDLEMPKMQGLENPSYQAD